MVISSRQTHTHTHIHRVKEMINFHFIAQFTFNALNTGLSRVSHTLYIWHIIHKVQLGIFSKQQRQQQQQKKKLFINTFMPSNFNQLM